VTAPPSVSAEHQAASRELAGRSERLAAVLIDAVIATIIGLAVLAFSGGLETLLRDKALPSRQLLLESLCSWTGFFAINLYFLLRNGQTIGKYLLGVRIADLNGDIPALWRIIFLRYLPTSILGLFGFLGAVVSTVDSLMIFRRSRRCLHDLIAGTRVLKA
jgi:uncharacterized RDD family membrane protein YckC